MHFPGQSRGGMQHDHYVQTPDTFVRAPLPGMRLATAIVHTGPPGSARFTEYTAEIQAGGQLGPTNLQRFVYVMEGSVEVGTESLSEGHFAYIKQGAQQPISAPTACRMIVIEKKFDGVKPPESFTRSVSQIAPQAVLGDPDVLVQGLIPECTEFDFAVNVLTFNPGAMLGQVEMHVMEHGLLMLEGCGVYRLSLCWYSVSAGDFIYMAPFCPQWFGALGKSKTSYLLYKDWNRHPDNR